MTTTVKERGILFSARLIGPIQKGLKTQTRRIMRFPQPEDYLANYRFASHPDSFAMRSGREITATACPYGVAGDRLYVREQCALWCDKDGKIMRDVPHPVVYRADYESDGWDQIRSDKPDGENEGWKVRPSIHLPRWASRIDLEIVKVWPERLHDITHEGAVAEGVRFDGTYWQGWSTARQAFRALWDSINGKRNGCSWISNPWVWCVLFKLLGD